MLIATIKRRAALAVLSAVFFLGVLAAGLLALPRASAGCNPDVESVSIHDVRVVQGGSFRFTARADNRCGSTTVVALGLSVSDGNSVTDLTGIRTDVRWAVAPGRWDLSATLAIPASVSPGSYVVFVGLYRDAVRADAAFFWRGASSPLRIRVDAEPQIGRPTCRGPSAWTLGATVNVSCRVSNAADRSIVTQFTLSLVDGGDRVHAQQHSVVLTPGANRVVLAMRVATFLLDGPATLTVSLSAAGVDVSATERAVTLRTVAVEVGCPPKPVGLKAGLQAAESYWHRLVGERLDFCTEQALARVANLWGDVIGFVSPAEAVRSMPTIYRRCTDADDNVEDECHEVSAFLTVLGVFPGGGKIAKGAGSGLRKVKISFLDDAGQRSAVMLSKREVGDLLEAFRLRTDGIWRHRAAPGMDDLIGRLTAPSARVRMMAVSALDRISRLPSGHSVLAIGTHGGRQVPWFTVREAGGEVVHVRSISGDALATASDDAIADTLRASGAISTKVDVITVVRGPGLIRFERFGKVVGVDIVFTTGIASHSYDVIARLKRVATQENVVLDVTVSTTRR